MSSASTQPTGQGSPNVQFRQVTEIVLDDSAVQELASMAKQSRAMMNTKGEAHLQLQQSIEAGAT
eukprot:2202665-Prorocentrum_lima.AAC.1